MPIATPSRPWAPWYSTKRWARKAREQMREHPLCVMCLSRNKIFAAQVADHIIPHHGDYHLFWYGKLQSLCMSCHAGLKKQEENQGFTREIGVDGWPVDPRHPANAKH